MPRLQSAWIVARLWETKITVLPAFATSAIFASDLRWKEASPTASTSSTSRISGSRWAATAKASRTDIPLE